jgi:beta-galactosidase
VILADSLKRHLSTWGQARITYMGTVPNEALARDIAAWAARRD